MERRAPDTGTVAEMVREFLASGQIRDADGYICEVIDAARESK